MISSTKTSIIEKEYFPEKKIGMLTIRFRRTPLAFESILRILREKGSSVYSMIIQSHPEEELSKATLFIEIEKGTEVSEVISAVKDVKEIVDLHIIVQKMKWGEARLIVFPLEDMDYLFSMLRDLGTGGLAVMYHMGRNAGEHIFDRFSVGREDKKLILKHFLLYLESLGYGEFKVQKYNDRIFAVIHAYDLFECIGKSKVKGSNIFRGLLTGFFVKLWETDVVVEETKCRMRGNKYCEFIIKPKR